MESESKVLEYRYEISNGRRPGVRDFINYASVCERKYNLTVVGFGGTDCTSSHLNYIEQQMSMLLLQYKQNMKTLTFTNCVLQFGYVNLRPVLSTYKVKEVVFDSVRCNGNFIGVMGVLIKDNLITLQKLAVSIDYIRIYTKHLSKLMED